MHSTKSFFIILIAFATVAALGGYFTGKITTPPPAPIEIAPTPASKPIVLKSTPSTEDTLRLNRAHAENEKLRQEIERLKAAIANGEAELAASDATLEATAEQLQQAPTRLGPPSMEELRQQDPEVHERMMQNIRQRQARMADMRQRRIDFLSGIDTTLLTPEEQATHQAYLQAVKQNAEMEAALFERQMNDEPLTEEDFEAIRESSMAVRALQEQERTALLNAVGAMWNVPEENLSDFVNAIEEVNEVLSNGGRGGRGGPMIFMGPPPGGAPMNQGQR